MSVSNVLAGRRILTQVESPINGELTVVRDIAWGTYIKAGGVTQSGGVANKVCNTALRLTKRKKKAVGNCLILGLGGGGIVNIVKRYWKDAKIVGVDIDPVIVELGKKYLGLRENNVSIVIEDAIEFLRKESKLLKGGQGKKYDLIYVDVYIGNEVPEKFNRVKYIKDLKRILAKGGIVVFNRLYYGEKRIEAISFRKKLERFFTKVRTIYPEANVMFLCENR